jgi:hypothetical protein|tara:strand:+ start:237 stop:1631 length:1395 start_codon:yes stop_codon:yes gene_type:complete
MKTILFIWLTLSLSVYSSGQSISTRTGDDFGYRKYIEKTISTIEGKKFAVFTQMNKKSLAEIENLKIKDEIPLKSYINAFSFNSKIILQEETPKDKRSSSIKIIDTDKGLSSSKSIKVFDIGPGKKVKSYTRHTPQISKNEKYLVYRTTFTGKGQGKFILSLFDKDLNPQWQSEFQLNSNTKITSDDIEKIHLTDNGQVYILYTIGKEKIGAKDFFLSKFGENGVEKTYKLNSKGLRKYNLFFDNDNDNDNELSLYGYLYKENKEHLYTLKINADNLSDGRESASELKGHFTLYKKQTSMDHREFLPQEDGSIIIIGEERLTVVGEYSTGYQCYDISITKVTKEGDLLWTEKVHKVQESGNDVSFEFFQVSNKLHLFFFDNIKNEGQPNTHKLEKYVYPNKKSAFMTISLDLDKLTLSDRSIITKLGGEINVDFKTNIKGFNADKALFQISNDRKFSLLEIELK